MWNRDERWTPSYASRVEITVRSSIAGIVSRKRSANSHATPSVRTIPTTSTVAMALANRRRIDRRGAGWATAAGVRSGGTGVSARIDAGTRSVGGTGDVITRGSVSATGGASTTATAAPRSTGVVAGVS